MEQPKKQATLVAVATYRYLRMPCIPDGFARLPLRRECAQPRKPFQPDGVDEPWPK